jgi:hypothetical protein
MERIFAGVAHDGTDAGCWVCDEMNEATTTVLYRVPDTRAMRECIDQALAQLRHEAELERAAWARYAELLEAAA